MDSLYVVVDPERAGRTSHLVFTGVTLRTGAEAFPTESWTDFTVVVLSWWIPAVSRVYANGRREQLSFMEGPYWAEIWRDAAGSWSADLVENRRHRRVLRTITFDAEEFANSLVQAADVTLRLCRERGWWSSDADLLESSARSFGRG